MQQQQRAAEQQQKEQDGKRRPDTAIPPEPVVNGDDILLGFVDQRDTSETPPFQLAEHFARIILF
jgi:hypothetical protein